MDCCCCFTQKKPTCKSRKPNYQKLVDPYVQLSEHQVPLITSTPTVEYRVTSEVRHKDANQPGVNYLQNFTSLDFSDRMWWIKNRLCRQEAWIGDGSYTERRPQNLHHFGATTFDINRSCIPITRPSHEKYVNFLDKRKKDGKVPCTVGCTDRRGIKFTIPYPCDKYQSKDRWDPSSCCKKQESGPKATEYNICVPKKQCCTKKFVCEQQTCPPPSCEKYFMCKAEPCSGDCKEKPERKKAFTCCERNDDSKKLIISVPDGDRNRDIPIGNVRVYLPPEKQPKPCFQQKDYAYRCESRELLGSKLLTYCLCVRRNGLQDDCPRTPCRGRPACMTKPWPDCWPSGGCHGQDYDRINGVERVNPTLQYRRDNPQCGPHKPTPDVRLVVEQC